MTNLPIPGLFAPRLQKRLEAYASDKRGVAAVEFALIATPFFFLIFGLLEVCVLFIMSSVLEHGINEAARGIRTGEMQENGFGQVAFKNAVCAELFDLLDCDSKLRFDVKTFSSFSNTQNPNVIDKDGNLDDSDFQFTPGDANDVVVVRVFYEWELITPVLSKPLANMSNNRRLLQSTVAFRNEPFGE
ncbi:MAG: TadE/TadG family type IV pilus assembly protein [Pseudomonadota bacterium]